jgi:hypothetical protein
LSAIVSFGNAASAATVQVRTSGGASGLSALGDNIGDTFSDDAETLGVGPISVIGESIVSGAVVSGKASGSASGNASTGEMKLNVSAERSSSVGFGSGGAIAETIIRQDFTLSGIGTFDALMEVDVNWNAEFFFFVSQVRIFEGFGMIDFIQLDQEISPAAGSITNELLVASFEKSNEGTRTVSVEWFMNGNVNASPPDGGNGFVDASNTGLIFFNTDGTLTATPTTPGFLSDPAFLDDPDPSPVPLPASFGFLSLALGSLWIRRRFRQVA